MQFSIGYALPLVVAVPILTAYCAVRAVLDPEDPSGEARGAELMSRSRDYRSNQMALRGFSRSAYFSDRFEFLLLFRLENSLLFFVVNFISFHFGWFKED